MALVFKTSCSLQPSRSGEPCRPPLSLHRRLKSPATLRSAVSPVMASLSVAPAPAISETFSRLKKQGKVAFIPYITAGDPNLSTTSEALRILDACGSDIIELGMPYSDPLADGPVIQAAATRALAKGTNFDGVISMLNEVIPQISCPIALFSYYNPILKRGIKEFMSTIRNVGVHGYFFNPRHQYSESPHNDGEVLQGTINVIGRLSRSMDERIEAMLEMDRFKLKLDIYRDYDVKEAVTRMGPGLVVPDVPLEETQILREEASKNGIELVLLTTPTTPTQRMKAIVDASQGFVYLVSSVGVTGARASVSFRVQSLLQEIKEATTKPVAVGFGISNPEHVKQVARWGADGVIVGSAMVKILGDAKSPQEGLKELEKFTASLKAALP